MQPTTSGVAVPVRKDALLRFRQTLNAAVPWDKPGLSRSERVIAFLQDLTISIGKDAGKKLKLRPFQRQFVEQVYAEQRLVRTAVLSCARKQGKTFLAAGLALCHLCGSEREPHGQVFSCANDRFQASQIFQAMYAMIVAHPWLSARTKTIHFHKQIFDLQAGSQYAALSREAKTKMGLSASFCIYDEYGSSFKNEYVTATIRSSP